MLNQCETSIAAAGYVHIHDHILCIHASEPVIIIMFVRLLSNVSYPQLANPSCLCHTLDVYSSQVVNLQIYYSEGSSPDKS